MPMLTTPPKFNVGDRVEIGGFSQQNGHRVYDGRIGVVSMFENVGSPYGDVRCDRPFVRKGPKFLRDQLGHYCVLVRGHAVFPHESDMHALSHSPTDG